MEIELSKLTNKKADQAKFDLLQENGSHPDNKEEEEDEMQEEEIPIRIPLLSPNHDETTASQSSGHDAMDDGTTCTSVSSSDNDDLIKPSLPLAVLLSYSIYGFTMSLPSLPMMYILNTRVPLPLSILPTYGALSFLPYSFKPLYAFWSSTYFASQRQGLLLGWGLCALTAIGWTWVPSVPWVFVVGISNGCAMAWSGFLLGLTLLDNARGAAQHQQQSTTTNNNNNNHNHDTTTTTTTFEVSASVFQSQAATARNVGSLSASIVTCLVFGMNTATQEEWSESLVDGLFWATAACHIASFFLVVVCRQAFEPVATIETPTTPVPSATTTTTETTRWPSSYAALEVHHGNYDEEEHSNAESDDEDNPPSSMCSINVIIIVALQLSILFLAMRQQILDGLAGLNSIILIAVGLVVLFTTMTFCCYRHHGRGTATTTRTTLQNRLHLSWSHVVGVVLILRHAVPDTSAILSSFLYHCFQTQPVWLQVFSLADTGMITLASWSYQKLWAPQYSHGRKLITLMAMLTVVKHSLQNIYLFVVHTNDYTSHSMFPWMVLAIKSLSAFVMEWSFLPSIVLATVSVSETKATWMTTSDDAATNDQQERSSNCHNDEETLHTTSTGQEDTSPKLAIKPSASTNVMYGSLVSCIDFGDQIGAILVTPLVTALGITRENNWHNLDTLIELCSGIGVLSAGIFVVLLFFLPSSPDGKPRQRQEF
ncbi:expressed unknown protein [Seminavis robusta]|uniref:Uncharacterized protein n=1 Tax=Seminavis robusta TaxID=568900 RepID=A0A9N8F131_9STRA|nr:expressed unknown protein [Seminavis robusta]|eukprot:Sro2555_g331140.1 n/a (711) ;mRNA; r:10030-12162